MPLFKQPIKWPMAVIGQFIRLGQLIILRRMIFREDLQIIIGSPNTITVLVKIIQVMALALGGIRTEMRREGNKVYIKTNIPPHRDVAEFTKNPFIKSCYAGLDDNRCSLIRVDLDQITPATPPEVQRLVLFPSSIAKKVIQCLPEEYFYQDGYLVLVYEVI